MHSIRKFEKIVEICDFDLRILMIPIMSLMWFGTVVDTSEMLKCPYHTMYSHTHLFYPFKTFLNSLLASLIAEGAIILCMESG